jgi:hypothetical protein
VEVRAASPPRREAAVLAASRSLGAAGRFVRPAGIDEEDELLIPELVAHPPAGRRLALTAEPGIGTG